jgi:hypothetical protein
MSQCLNPTCLYQNPQGTNFCEKCGGKILLDDRYRPIKFLGEGGFGRTFQAEMLNVVTKLYIFKYSIIKGKNVNIS